MCAGRTAQLSAAAAACGLASCDAAIKERPGSMSLLTQRQAHVCDDVWHLSCRLVARLAGEGLLMETQQQADRQGLGTGRSLTGCLLLCGPVFLGFCSSNGSSLQCVTFLLSTHWLV